MVKPRRRFRKVRPAAFLAGLLLALAPALGAEGAGRKADYLVGEVTAVDPSARRLTLKADSGEGVPVVVPEAARLMRAKPGATSLAGATPTSLQEIAVGDRVMVQGALEEDGSTRRARQLVVMTRGDLTRKREAEQSEWRRRGILGRVTGVDSASGEITVRVGRGAGVQTLVLPTADRSIVFRRYAPDSVKFGEARPSAVGEVRVGDELRALGTRSEDGRSFLAEQVVSGSFRSVSGAVTSVDRARAELIMRDDESRHSLVVAVGPDARLRRLAPEIAARLAGRPEASAPGPEDLLDRLPPLTLAEVKAGDRILVSSTRGSDPARLNAIALVTGLEALAAPGGRGRAGRGAEVGLPAELLDLGMSIP